MKKSDVNFLEPSQEQLNSLLEHYQARRYEDAKRLSISITQEFPKHPFAWKVLGAVLKQMGKINESLVATQKSVQLDPQDAAAHSNLGVTLQELGKLDEAEASLRQAITLKPDYAEVHYNLGITLKELGKLDEAKTSYRKVITLKPDYAEAHYNLGNTLKEQGRLNEAEASYGQAITLKPDHAAAHSNLGATLQELGKLDEAEASYRKAIALKPDHAEAHYNLGKVYKKIAKYSKAVECFEKTLELSSEDLMGATLQLATLGKRKIPDKTPEKYMREFYRKKSKNWNNFDKKKNNYRGHLLIENAFKKTHNISKKIDILDMGCGTGSLARILRPYARSLVGVDLSPDMLFKAKEICLYDSLYEKDLSQYLGEVLNYYDTVVAAAVLIHFNDLDNIFFLVRDSLKINGRFIFSIFEETQKNKDLNSFLMYAHSDDYVTALSDRLNLKIIYRQKDIHEYHKGNSVPAIIYVLEKK